MACLLVFMAVLGTLVKGFRDNKRICTDYGYDLKYARFQDENYWLCLKQVHIGSTSLATADSAVLLDPDAEESDNVVRGLPLDVIMSYGYPVGHTGSAEGYIGDDQQFYGVMHLGNRTIHADPYGKDDIRRKFGAFEPTVIFDEIEEESMRRRREEPHAQIHNRKRIPGHAHGRICELLLLADKEFYEKDSNSSLKQAVRRMMHAVAQADIIFRNSDFNEDGVPDNIGFSVKYIIVLTSEETNKRVFGDLLRSSEVDGKQYLMRFARLRRLSEVCLGVAFSGHAFFNRTLGLSFTSLGGGMGGAAGGLCDRRAYGRSFNTLALSHTTSDDKERVPERIAGLTLAHELGHSFGAHHDDNFPNPECKGYLMDSQSSNADSSRHFEFSICSKRHIAPTLHSMSYCLIDDDKPYCGNGIVEKGEACDCGMPSSCNSKDPCCTPRAGGVLTYIQGAMHVEGCTVSLAALCHPSQGMCCSAQCGYADLLASGIDCGTMNEQCYCNHPSCRCAYGGRCLPDGTCHASECALLGLRECRCSSKGPGGQLSEARMCGVCCQLDSEEGSSGANGEMCVGAELAAKLRLDKGHALPPQWPDDAYRGPNISIKICGPGGCVRRTLRAWATGDVCVSRGVVGYCSLNGVCKSTSLTPRSNVYPAIKLKTYNRTARLVAKLVKKSKGDRTLASLVLILCVIFVVN